MSLDIAVVLAHLTNRVLVPYRFRLPRRSQQDLKPGSWPEPLLIPDLFEIPVPCSEEYLLKTWISMKGKHDCAWQPVFESVLCFPPSLPRDNARFQSFRNGRQYVYTFDERQNEAADLHLNTYTLGHYSHFFYLDEERRREVISLMKRLRPKQPYIEVADRIVASLGTFNAVHVRRGDFLSNDLSKAKISRAASISGQEVLTNLASRMRRDDLLVICTDGSSCDEFFGPIQKYFREVIFLDRYLRENASIREMISQLPRHNEAVEVLLTQLVASNARVFIGTLFSTFTALIHRLRGLNGRDSSFFYCYNDFLSPLVRFERCEFLPVDDGPYSWNRIRYPVSAGAYSWLREWPEAFDAAPPPEDQMPPSATLDLLASGATVHGNTLRLMEDDGGQKVIGHWSNPTEFVTWNFTLPAVRDHFVEIQYACPEEFSGGRYHVVIDGAGELEGRVWTTGGWTSLSPWLTLGRLRIPAGRSALAVRVIEKASDTLMNLSAVRLVPAEPAFIG